MILDKMQMFSEDQDLAQTASTYYSTNVIDLGDAAKGEGEPIEVLIQVTEAFTSTGAATLVIVLQTDSVEAMSSPTAIFTSATLALATIAVVGYKATIRVLPNDCEQYLRIAYTIGTATTTAGKISAGLVRNIPTNP